MLQHPNQSTVNGDNWKTVIKSVLLIQSQMVIKVQLLLHKGHWMFSIIFKQYYGYSAESLHRKPTEKRGLQGFSHYSATVQMDQQLKM